jgi:hypothetical protein
LVAYADDFLVFTSQKLLEMFPETETFIAAGLQYAKNKSRMLKGRDEWLVPTFKFLGNTLITGKVTNVFPATAEVEPNTLRVIGTPRSGAVNLPMDPAVHTALKARDSSLWSILRSKITREEFGFYGHPSALLAA